MAGDPMIKRYQAAENPAIFKKKRRRYGDPVWLIIVKVALLLLLVGIVVGTCILLMQNPMGIHRPW